MSRRLLTLAGAGSALLASALTGVTATASATSNTHVNLEHASNCAYMTKTQAAHLAESRVARVPGHAWTTQDAGNRYDPCSPLSWIDLSITGSTASSPHQIALFSQGRFLGTATAKAYGFTPTINRLSSSSIQVTYHWPRSGDANANPTGKSVAHFTWSPTRHKVVMSGNVPPAHD